MTTGDLIRDIIAGLALIVSLVTAYKTLLARFSGKVFPASYLALTHAGEPPAMVPAIGLGCFFENSGARPGILDDLRLIVKHSESGAIYFFYPQLFRNDYNIFASYGDKDWFVFGGISLSAREKMDRYVLFKPLNNKYKAEGGSFEVTLESRWHQSKEWKSTRPVLRFELSATIAEQWNDQNARAYQVASSDLINHRKAFAN